MMRNSCSRIEHNIFRLVNSSRKKRHLHKMDLNRGLSRLARKHSKRMVRSGNIFHDPHAGFENVAYLCHPGQSDWEIAQSFHRQWMGSSGHRANILNHTNNSIGIGVARRGNHFYATQKFTYRARHGRTGHFIQSYQQNAGEAIVYVIVIVFILWLIFLFFK